MKISIGAKEYEMNGALAASAKKMVRTVLNEVKKEADTAGVSKFYTAFVIMMYLVTGSVLEHLGKSAYKEITNAPGEREKEAIDKIGQKLTVKS